MLITAISAAAFRDIIVEDTSLDLSPPSSTMSSLSSGNGADASICPPLRFAKLFDGLSRSAYPTLKNFRFMRRLQLKTIVSLVPEPPTRDLADFCALFSINLVHISVNKAEALSPALHGLLMQALHVCINRDNHPALVHCLDGRHTTSLLLLLLQRAMGYSPLSAISDYWRFQIGAVSQITQSEIEKYTKELEKFTNEMGVETVIPEHIPPWLWTGCRGSRVKGVKLKFSPPLELAGGSITSSSFCADVEVDRDSESGPPSVTLSVNSTPSVCGGNGNDEVFSEGLARGVGSNNLIGAAQSGSNVSTSANNSASGGEEISRNVDALSLDGLDVGFVRKRISQ